MTISLVVLLCTSLITLVISMLSSSFSKSFVRPDGDGDHSMDRQIKVERQISQAMIPGSRLVKAEVFEWMWFAKRRKKLHGVACSVGHGLNSHLQCVQTTYYGSCRGWAGLEMTTEIPKRRPSSRHLRGTKNEIQHGTLYVHIRIGFIVGNWPLHGLIEWPITSKNQLDVSKTIHGRKKKRREYSTKRVVSLGMNL